MILKTLWMVILLQLIDVVKWMQLDEAKIVIQFALFSASSFLLLSYIGWIVHSIVLCAVCTVLHQQLMRAFLWNFFFSFLFLSLQCRMYMYNARSKFECIRISGSTSGTSDFLCHCFILHFLVPLQFLYTQFELTKRN